MQNEFLQGLDESIIFLRRGKFGRDDGPPSPEKIVQIRKAAQMTQSKFADFLGISVHTIKSWESGRRTPGKLAGSVLHKLAKKSELA